jgi:hypothetical protein
MVIPVADPTLRESKPRDAMLLLSPTVAVPTLRESKPKDAMLLLSPTVAVPTGVEAQGCNATPYIHGG